MARHFIQRLIIGSVLLAGFTGAIGMADTRTLSPEEARQAAWRALHAHKPHITLQLANALRKRTPDDFELVLLRAVTFKDVKRHSEAVKAGKDAFRKAETDGHKFDAAHLVAKSHFANGSEGLAQLWLRRAEQNAPNEQSRNAAVRDFQFVRRVKPWTTRLNFNVFPTSNINNGSTYTEDTLVGVPLRVSPTNLPHSGTGITLGVNTTYSKRISQRQSVRFEIAAQNTMYRFSSKTKRLGSGLRASDLAFQKIELQVGTTILPKNFTE